MKKLFLVPLVILLVSVFIFSGCAKPTPAPSPAPTPAPTPAGTIKVGVMYPLTGPLAMTGKRMVDAATFAFEQAGLIAGKKIEVIAEDTGEPDPSIAVDKARKLVEFDKVCAIIGPLTPPAKFSVGSYMAQAGVPRSPLTLTCLT